MKCILTNYKLPIDSNKIDVKQLLSQVGILHNNNELYEVIVNNDTKNIAVDKFNLQNYKETLNPLNELGSLMIFNKIMKSTQDYVIEYGLKESVNKLVVLANQQKNGKGRGKNIWVSPEGCLSFSFQSLYKNGKAVPFVQYLVSLAVVRAIKTANKNIDIAIKWPNDLVVKNNNTLLKIGGILCQSSYSNKEFIVTNGIGINVFNEEPTICINSFSSEDNMITKEFLLALILNEYESLYNEFNKSNSFEPFLQEYLSYWLHSDQEVQVDLARTHQTVANNQVFQPKMIKAKITSISLENGALTAINTLTQETIELHPDGNSFDFMKGLICRKI